MIENLIKKILISIISVFIVTTSACALGGTYTDNGYFYLPAYGAFGVAELAEYDAYMQIADTQIEANKTASGDENIEDKVGAMTTGNTETFITVTYQDATADIDFVVPVKDEDNMASNSATFLVTQQSVKAYADTLHALQYLKTELDDFSELQSIISDKTLINEEDICTIDANWVNTAHPWADNEVANNITIDLATLATTITVTDNEATNENNPICFVAGADPDGGSLGIETDGDLHYNPSTGTLTATGFAGALTGNVTGDASGSSGSCTGNAATTTALANARNIGGVSFDGTANIVPTTIVVADTTDTTSFIALWESATGSLLPKSDGALLYNAGTGMAGASNIFFGNFSAAAAPVAATDDITLGYVVGSQWIDTTGDEMYICLDNTDGAAVWSKAAPGGGGGSVDTSGTPAGSDFAKFTDADTIEGRSYSEVRTDLGLVIGTNVLAEQTIGIANDNLVEIDHASVADNDIPKFTANGLEGRSPLEHRNDVENYVIYPQDYATGAGTVGDPWTGSCIDDAYNASSAGDVIYMRAGYYQLDVAIDVDTGGVSFIGEGVGRTIIETADLCGFIITVDNVTLRGFTIDGDDQTAGAIPVMNIHDCNYIKVLDVEVENGIQGGITPANMWYSTFRNLYLHDNAEHGIHPGDTTGSSVKSKHNTYENIWAWNNGDSGFDDKGVDTANRPYYSYNTYNNIWCWDNATHQLSIGYQRGISASNLYAWSNLGLTKATGGGMYLIDLHDSSISDCIARNSYSNASSAYGIWIRDCDDVRFANCVGDNNEDGGFRIYNSTNITLTNCQATDSRTLTGIDIAFVDGAAGADTITMTDARFLEIGLWAGKDITITGAGQAGNNSTFTITSVVAGTITLPTASLTTEAAGATVTITQEKTQAYGLKVESSSDNINLINCDFTGNLTSKISTDSSTDIRGKSTHDITVDHDYNGTFEMAKVGESVVFGELLYFNWTDKEWKKTDADAAATMPGLRIALDSKADGVDCLMLVEGHIRDDSAYAFAGSIVYASCTPGDITSTAPSASGDQVQRVGQANHADYFYFDPSIDQGEI